MIDTGHIRLSDGLQGQNPALRGVLEPPTRCLRVGKIGLAARACFSLWRVEESMFEELIARKAVKGLGEPVPLHVSWDWVSSRSGCMAAQRR